MFNKVFLILVILSAAAGIYVYEIRPRLRAYEYVCNMPIGEIELAKISDGAREGEFRFADIYCKVKVTVKNHKIESVEIVQNASNALAKKAEKVVNGVLSAQSLKVECISGATGSSKAILKSIENALK